MTDFNTFLQSDEFKAYRKKQIEQVGSFIEGQVRQMINGSSDNAVYINGALRMANLMIGLPEKLVASVEVKQNLSEQKKEDIAALTTYLVRRQMITE